MPKLPNKKDSKKAEEGLVVKESESMFEYLAISNKELGRISEAIQEVANTYSRMAESLIGPARALFKAQEQIANQLLELSNAFAKFNQINFVIPIPRLDQYVFPKFQSIPIYVQPDQPYIPIKQLQGGEKKRSLSLSAIKIEGNGFTIEGEYIKGLTLKSKAGRLLELMIRDDLHGSIPYELIGKATKKSPTDYRAWGFVIRDLKEILMVGGKFKIDMERYPGLKRYQINRITKYSRKPRKSKKVKNMDLIN